MVLYHSTRDSWMSQTEECLTPTSPSDGIYRNEHPFEYYRFRTYIESIPSEEYLDLAEQVIEENRYLAFATTDGEAPWIAPIENIYDESGDFFFFSTIDSRHAKHIEAAVFRCPKSLV